MKYYQTWEEYKASHPEAANDYEETYKRNLQPCEEAMFSFIMNLLV